MTNIMMFWWNRRGRRDEGKDFIGNSHIVTHIDSQR